MVHLPQGTLVAITSGKDIADLPHPNIPDLSVAAPILAILHSKGCVSEQISSQFQFEFRQPGIVFPPPYFPNRWSPLPENRSPLELPYRDSIAMRVLDR